MAFAKDLDLILEENYEELSELTKELAIDLREANPDDKRYLSELLTRAVALYASISEMSAQAQSIYRIEKNRNYLSAKSTPISRSGRSSFPSDKEADAKAILATEKLLILRNNYSALMSTIQEIVYSIKRLLGGFNNGGVFDV